MSATRTVAELNPGDAIHLDGQVNEVVDVSPRGLNYRQVRLQRKFGKIGWGTVSLFLDPNVELEVV